MRVLVGMMNWVPNRTLKKYKSRPRAVLGALLPFHGVWPIMTIAIHSSDTRVSSMGVRIHAKRPILPMFAAVALLPRPVLKRSGGVRLRTHLPVAKRLQNRARGK